MTEMELLPTRYPQVHPWFDLSPFLVNGWKPMYPQTALVSLESNRAYWSVLLDGSEATSHTIANNLPASLRGLTTTPLHGSIRSVNVDLRLTSQIYLTGTSVNRIGGDFSGFLSISGITPLGAS